MRVPVRRACEVGFNEGHSAAALLLSSKTLNVVSIEVGEEEHVSRAAALLSSLFPGRLEVIRQNSSLALPMLAERSLQCDLVRIDGSHVGDMPWLDLLNSKLVASGPRIVWMDDVGCSNWNCREPTAAWERAKRQGLVDEVECSVSQETESHGYCIATFAPKL